MLHSKVRAPELHEVQAVVFMTPSTSSEKCSGNKVAAEEVAVSSKKCSAVGVDVPAEGRTVLTYVTIWRSHWKMRRRVLNGRSPSASMWLASIAMAQVPNQVQSA